MFYLIIILIPKILNYLRSISDRQGGKCIANLDIIGRTIIKYKQDKGHYPVTLSQLIPDYLRTIPTCPSAIKDTYTEGYIISNSLSNFTVYCNGHNHKNLNIHLNYPQFSSKYSPKHGVIINEESLKRIESK